MDIDLSEFIQIFFEEGAEHLAQMETLLVGLDLESPEPEQLNAIFRAAHSVKGAASTFGFEDISSVTHILENQLDRVRKGTMGLRQDMVDVFLEAADTLQQMIKAHQLGQEADVAAAEALCERLHALEGSAATPATPQTTATGQLRWTLTINASGLSNSRLPELEFALRQEGWLQCPNGATTNEYIITLPKGRASPDDTILFFLAPTCYTLTSTPYEDMAADMGLFDDTDPVTADMGLFEDDVVEMDDGMGLFDVDDASPVPPTANDMGLFVELPATAAPAEEMGLFDTISPLPSGSEATGLMVEPKPIPTGNEQATSPNASRPKSAPSPAAAPEVASIRVSTEKVDEQINLVGELVITHAMLIEATSGFDPIEHEKLFASLALLERNTRALQESAMSIRMMPISSVFSRFPRVVRDTANKLGKKVRLVTQGENTELDRSLIEKLSDPLTHLVRNSLDHGIEASAVRQDKGKDPVGTLTLKAYHQGGNIVIQVRDDGAGLNRDRILAKARSQGMPVDDDMPDADVWPLIFEPGFSTAEVVTDVSGRGVGMDVVKRNIASMGGRIDIDTVRDVGTTMTIRLPLTLAILDGMAVRHGRETFIVPLGFIVESLRASVGDVRTLSGRGRVLHVRGEYLPIVALHQVFGGAAPSRPDGREMFIVLEAGQGKTALLVDDLLGQHQVVIKSLESNFRKLPGLSGATIMGDGHVALIVDVESLIRLGQQQSNEVMA